MTTRTSLSLLAAVVWLMAAPLGAAETTDVAGTTDQADPNEKEIIAESQGAPKQSPGNVVTTGEVTPKLYLFDYFSGFGEDRTQFIERYNSLKGFDDDRRSDFFLDADFHLSMRDDDRELLSIDRVGFGRHNNRGTLEANRDFFAINAYYGQFRSATGGINWLFSANQVPGGTEPLAFFPSETNANSGYFAQFNDDSGRTRFDINRVNYGIALKVKPTAFNEFAAVKVGYNGYQRTGNQMSKFVLGGGDIREAGTNAQTPGRVLQRWRGVDQEIDESLNRFKLTLTGTPKNRMVLDYDLSYDKYNNSAPNLTHSDVSAFLPPEWQYNTGGNAARPLGFAPDSHLLRHGFRASHASGKFAVLAGFGQSWLEQDTFTHPQQQQGFVGETSTNNAFLNIATNAIAAVRLDGFFRYYQRDNDSTFPVPGLIDPIASEQLGVRINQIETLNYGLNASFRSRALATSFVLGWKHEEKDRSLTFHQSSIDPPINGTSAERSLLRNDTEYNEVSLKMVSRLGKAVTLRITPSYLWADETGLVTEPEKSFRLKSNVSYVTEAGGLLTAYYNYRKRTNDDSSFLGTDGELATQDNERANQSAGLSFGWQPSEWINAQAGVSWLQDDFMALFYGSNRRRFEAPNNPVIFFLRDESTYNVDTYVAMASVDWQVSDTLNYQFGYTYSRSDGRTASGVILSELPTQDGRIDNVLHSFQAGVQYQRTPNIRLSSMYVIDYYDDDAFDDLTGGAHSLMLGVTVDFQ